MITTWCCTHPGEREFDPADDSPLPELERCVHPECKPTGPQVVLDAERETEEADSFTLRVADIKRADIKPGEVLAVTLPPQAVPQDSARVRKILQELLPDVKILVVSHGVDLQVFNPHELAEQATPPSPR